ncbi:response regulator transcription factor [Mesorhizobium sp. SB112]|uniref:winged helix-turn-helix transcriptional regulator n=1 Tax=Mesorhizobium sp. SB112 TaxID=3151853 RepID=UPI00326648D4
MIAVRPVVALNSDDPELYLVLQHILAAEGYELHLIADAEDLDRLLEAEKLHAIILDGASDIWSSMDICSRRMGTEGTRSVPVAALIPSGASAQHIQLIKAGIDEGLLRPLIPSRLLQFLHKKSGGAVTPSEVGKLAEGKSLQQHILEMDVESQQVHCNGRQFELPPIGFRLLKCLLKTPGRVLSREALMAAGWPRDARINRRSVDIHIARLRKSLRAMSAFDMIRTVRSVGYALQTCGGEQASYGQRRPLD